MDVRALTGSRPEGSGGWQVVHGYVSLERTPPASFADPVWVIVPSHSSDQPPYGPLTWPASHGATLPVKGSPVVLALAIGLDGTPGVPAVLAWDGPHS